MPATSAHSRVIGSSCGISALVQGKDTGEKRQPCISPCLSFAKTPSGGHVVDLSAPIPRQSRSKLDFPDPDGPYERERATTLDGEWRCPSGSGPPAARDVLGSRARDARSRDGIVHVVPGLGPSAGDRYTDELADGKRHPRRQEPQQQLTAPRLPRWLACEDRDRASDPEEREPADDDARRHREGSTHNHERKDRHHGADREQDE